jgi:pimeloyl-ACP methyl ester carboxylesterase
MRQIGDRLAISRSVLDSGAVHAAMVDGATIHWTSTGTGRETLIFVHGWTCDGSCWEHQVQEFANGYRVITLDLPGHGRSRTPAPLTISLFARAVDAVRLDAKVDRAVLIGHSMGTPVIRKYALTYPQRVSALVLVDGLIQNPHGAPSLQPTRNGVPPPRPETDAEELKARHAMIRGMFGPLTTPALQERIIKMMMGTPEATAAGAMTATQDRTQWSAAPVTLPVLAVYAGTRPLAHEAALKMLFPAAEYHTISQTAHFLMMERPDDFNRLLSAFLYRVSGRR